MLEIFRCQIAVEHIMSVSARSGQAGKGNFCEICIASQARLVVTYPNVPFTVLHRKGTEGAGVHEANPKSHSYRM